MRKLLYTLFVLLTGCGVILEEDISTGSVELIAPPDNIEADVYAQTLWWNEVDGAIEYELQVVHPSFDSIVYLMLDTVTSKTSYTYSFQPGEYQWRVRALNAGYETDFSTRSLTILNGDLEQQEVVLSSPLGDTLFGPGMTMKWQKVSGATEYILQIAGESSFTTILLEENIQAPLGSSVVTRKVQLEEPDPGIYYWRVKGSHSASETPFANDKITIDNTAPAQNREEVNNSEVTLSWETGLPAESFEVGVMDEDGRSISGAPFIVNDNYITFEVPLTADTLDWNVTAFDREGNKGLTSDKQRFYIPSTTF